MVAWSLTSCTVLMYLSFVQTVSKKKQTRCLDRNKKCDFRLKFDPNHIWRLFEKRLQSDFSLRCLKSHFKLSPLNRTTHKQLHPTLDGGSGEMSSFLSDPGSCFNAKSRKSTSSLLLLHRPRTSVWHKSPPEDDFCRVITCPRVTLIAGLPARKLKVLSAEGQTCRLYAAVSRSD